jgi:hypothetical protein
VPWTSTVAPRLRVLTGPLTERGLVVALTYRLRVAVEQVDDETQDAILAGLAELVAAHCPPILWPKPAA